MGRRDGVARTPTHTEVEFWRDEALPGVELRTSTYRDSVFREHSHTAYSVGLIDAGSTCFTLKGRSWLASAGQVVVIDPDEPHSCNPKAGSLLSYRMLYVEPHVMSPAAKRAPAFSSPVICDPQLFIVLDRLFSALVQPIDVSTKQRLMRSTLRSLAEEYADETGRTEDRNGPLVEAVKLELHDHLADGRTLDEIARAVGASRSQICRAFRAIEHLTPRAYQNQLRVQRAKELLREGLALGDVAVEVGFADQSHLSRVFRKYTGATPQQYQTSRTA